MINPSLKLLLFTSKKYERFVDRGIAVLECRTQSAFRTAVISNLGNFKYPVRFICHQQDWVQMALGGVKAALAANFCSEDDHLIVAMEDHIPYRSMDIPALLGIHQFVCENSIEYLNLFGLKSHSRITEYNGQEIRKVWPVYYSSLTPAIWRVCHLLELLETAVARGIQRPWDFEKTECPQPHGTLAKMHWPMVTDGFMAQGRVNKVGLYAMIKNLDKTVFPLLAELMGAYAIERASRALSLDARVYR